MIELPICDIRSNSLGISLTHTYRQHLFFPPFFNAYQRHTYVFWLFMFVCVCVLCLFLFFHWSWIYLCLFYCLRIKIETSLYTVFTRINSLTRTYTIETIEQLFSWKLNLLCLSYHRQMFKRHVKVLWLFAFVGCVYFFGNWV